MNLGQGQLLSIAYTFDIAFDSSKDSIMTPYFYGISFTYWHPLIHITPFELISPGYYLQYLIILFDLYQLDKTLSWKNHKKIWVLLLSKPSKQITWK